MHKYILALLASVSVVSAQEHIYKAPTPADWAALAKLPDFSGVWELGTVGRGGNAAFGTAPAGARGAAAGERGAGQRGAGAGGGGGLNPEQARVMTEAIEILKQQGAIVVDPADIPSIVTQDPDKNFLSWGQCSGTNNAKGKDAACSVVLKYGMKRDFNKWLSTLGPSAPVKTLTELREWKITHTFAGAIRFGESDLDISD